MTLSIPLFAQDLQYPAWLMRKQFASMMNPGVTNPLSDLLVTATTGMLVQAAPGGAYIPQTIESQEPATSDMGLYYIYNDGPIQPSNSVVAPASNPRVDTVGLRVYDVTEQVIAGNSKCQLEWVQGFETSGATLANLAGIGSQGNNYLPLAWVLQTPGESAINPNNVLNIAQASFGAGSPGQLIPSAAWSVPGAVACDGTAYSRVGYSDCFKAITATGAAVFTSGGITISSVPTSVMNALFIMTGGNSVLASGGGIPISGPNIAGGATISAYSMGGNTITMSVGATASGSALFVIAPWGIGDGSTTFNVPLYTGRALVGIGSDGSSVRAMGNRFGEQAHTLTNSENAPHSHGGATGTGVTGTGGTGVDSPDHSHNISRAYLMDSNPGGLITEFDAGGTGASGSTGIARMYSDANLFTNGANQRHFHSVPSLSVPALAIGSDGGGAAHNNVQMSAAAMIFIKL